MWMQDLVFALPIWACIIFAFAPATLVAIIVRPFSDELDAGRRTEKLRASLLAIVATAFVFIVGLSTNTLWRETSEISSALGNVAVQERDLYLLVADQAPEQADRVLELIATHNQLVVDQELRDGALAGNADLDKTMTELRQFVDQLPADLDDVDQIKEAYYDFLDSRDEYLRAIQDPGIPDIIWISVILLGTLFVGLLALQRRGRSRTFADVVMVGVVFAVGLIQLPLWTLSSYDLLIRMVKPDLLDAAQPGGGAGSQISGQVIATIVLGVALLLLVAATAIWKRERLRIDGDADDDTDDDKDAAAELEVRDVLIEIRDELRQERAAHAQALLDAKNQAPPDRS